jgi:hypothetical protein
MYTTLYSIVSRCQDVAQLLSLSTCTRRLVLWCRRVDSTASICFSAGVPLYILYLFSRTLALAVLDRTARHWSSAVTWPHTSKVGKHASSTCTCNNPKAPVSWICLLSVGSVYAQEPIMDGWWSVISLNCNLELCPPLHRFFERKVMLKLTWTCQSWNVECGEAGEAYCSWNFKPGMQPSAAFQHPWEMDTVSPLHLQILGWDLRSDRQRLCWEG